MKGRSYLRIGFFVGMAFLSLLNIILNYLQKNEAAYNLYAFALAISILLILLIIKLVKKEVINGKRKK